MRRRWDFRNNLDDHFSACPCPGVRVSASIFQGDRRPYQEDRATAFRFRIGQSTFMCGLVLDGHGGSDTVDMVLKAFPSALETNLLVVLGDGHEGCGVRGSSKKIRSTLKTTFEEMHTKSVELGYKDGTTASLILVECCSPSSSSEEEKGQSRVWVTNVGDSTIYGVHTGEKRAKKVSRDHNLDMPKEKSRLDASPHFSQEGNYVCNDRTGHMLNMTRSIGDASFDGVVKCVPDIFQIREPFNVFMLCTDGMWDVNRERQNVILDRFMDTLKPKQWRKSAHQLSQWRNATYPQHDNTCVMIVYLDWLGDKTVHDAKGDATPKS